MKVSSVKMYQVAVNLYFYTSPSLKSGRTRFNVSLFVPPDRIIKIFYFGGRTIDSVLQLDIQCESQGQRPAGFHMFHF